MLTEAEVPLSSYDTEADPLSATLATAAVEAKTAVEDTANSAISFFILFSI